MKFLYASIIILLLPISSAFQTPIRNVVGGAAAAAALVGAPLIAPAQEDTPTALVLDVKTNSDVVGIAKSVFSHRGQLQQAFKDFLSDAKQLEKDLDGVVPLPEVSLTAPSDVKQAARDALSGQARVVLNGNPVYFEVDSQEGFLTLKAVSPLIPKLPLLAPTPAEEATMVIPRTKTVYVKSSEALPVVAVAKSTPFWKWSFKVPGVKQEVTLPQAVGGVVIAAYGTTYSYHTISNTLAEREAEEIRKKRAAEAAAKKVKAAAKISGEITQEVEEAMTKTAEAKAPKEVEPDVSAEEVPKSKRSLLKRALGRKN
mmetsp:Transcript_31543/g.46550  ORF Transcript_31543/g.46550 Transcript_31543/m.46550 type:complete len:314 (+) Transcript_31543:134-1075(+)|eukprot:CAMPEP_0194240058 /NCGR_PEP_ID=MMETSP0158-20130606/6354_1 /TAXON_ID=33649 /ORGANISM="Thalassionema nitzschioides, Strain L26-B" /LENGTH=313 /DNA_ID=CAMNT_0038974693 /DNA_START=89 /DNA_END=1030 /DNA_ORIENTATION=-